MSIIFVLFICLSCVNAADINDTDIPIASDVDDVISIAPDEDIIGAGDVVKYYVNNSVDTSGNGSIDSPFKGLNDAIPLAESSKDVEIYIASGTYLVDARTDIDLNHVGDGGSLSLIGYGGDVTFDMQNKCDFLSVGANSKVNISNIMVINGYTQWQWNYQGIITSNGVLNIMNCAFVNNTAYSSAVKGSAKIYSSLFKGNTALVGARGIDYYGTGLIFNSTFYGNTRGQSIFGDGNLVVDKSKFINYEVQGCIYSYSPMNVTNCIFEDISERIIPIGVDSDVVLSNNTRSNDGYICYANSFDSLCVIEVLNNTTVDMEGFGVELSAKIFDDNGNLIRPGSVDFYLNETNVGTAYYDNTGYTLNYQKLLNGTYIVSAQSNGLKNFSVKTATLNIVPPKDKNVKYYVNNSVAVSGNGSIDSPFQGLHEAIELVNGYQNVEIYIASGRYEFNDYTFNIDANHEDGEGSLSLIGWGDTKPILDPNSSTFPFFVFSQNTVVYLKNLSFVNPTMLPDGSTFIQGFLIRARQSSLSVEDCTFNGTYRGLPFIETSGVKSFYCNNCIFENNTWGGQEITGYGHCIQVDGASDSILIINNCSFKNNVNYNNITSFYGTWDIPVIYGRGMNTEYTLIVSNSTFINNPTIYRDMNDAVKVNLIFDNDKFINTTAINNNQYMFQLYNPNTQITNCYFDLTPESRGALIYMQNYIYLENNTISESSPVKWFNLALDRITSTHYLTILDNSSVSVKSINIPLNATLTDDMGNLIQTSASCQFYIDGKYVTRANFNNGVAAVTTKGIYEDGNYTVSSSIQGTDNRIVRTGTLNFAQIKSIDVYVAETGDDENGDGSKDNPYKTIDKGLDVALNNALSGNLYVKGGNYNITEFVEISGQNLTIIGYDGEVIFDMQRNIGFCYVDQNTNVIISNIIFTNGVTLSGAHTYGVFTVNGNLNVFNCTFSNNKGYRGTIYETSSNAHVIIDSCIFKDNEVSHSSYGDYRGSGKVINSTFYGKNIVAICAYGSDNLVVDSSKFINSTKNCIKANGYLVEIKNSIFDNCTGEDTNAPIYNSNNVILYNNTLLNDGILCYASTITTSGTVEVLDNETIEMESFGVDLSAKIYDDNGNLVRINSLNFYLNETNAGSATFNNGVYTLKYKKLLNGTYIASVPSSGLVNFTVKTATLIITPLVNKDLYVSNSGSDENNGSEDYPFKTLDKAVSEATAYNNVIHIDNGNYNISSPLSIATAGGTFTIVGSDNTVVDLNKESKFINSISSDSIVVLKNLDIVNGYFTAAGGSITSSGNLTVYNVSFINSTSTGVGGAIVNNRGTLYVIDSKFINCTGNQAGAIYNTNYLYLENNTADNVVATSGTGNYIVTRGTVDGIILTFNDNATYIIDGASVTLNATVTDDNGNIITGNGVQVSFTLNDVNVATANLGDGIATTTVNIKLNGEFILSGTLGSSKDVVVKTATLIFNNSEVLNDVWVAVDGDDSNDGSREHPFATIEHALTVVSAVNPTIHIGWKLHIYYWHIHF